MRRGRCDDETERYFSNLSREFPSSSDSLPTLLTHIYFKRLPVEVHNANILASLSGPKLMFESSDTGFAKSLDRTISAVLHLKPGCRVMLLYNVSQQLRNGTCSEFVGVDPNGEALLVNFPKVGLVAIQRRIWYKYDATGKVKASLTQFHFSLCYAITTHNSQGLTMKRIVVHCSPEFIPGQTYVAISRVRHADDVRVVGFHKYFLMPPPISLTKLTTTSSGEPVPTFRCCRKIELDKACSFAVTEEIKSCIDDENGVAYNGLEYEAAITITII